MRLKPISEITINLGLDPNGPVQKFFTDTCLKHMDKYVPMRDGGLHDNLDVGTDYITYESPYAKYQYKGMRDDGTHVINPANRTRIYHPLATSYWDKHMVTAEMQDIEKEVQDFIERGGK